MYMKNIFDTENMVQTTFLKIMENPVVFQSDEHEKAWLIKTACNLCKNYLKHWWNKNLDIDNISEYSSQLSYDQTFHEDDVMKCIKSLPAKYKAVIYLYYYDGYSTSEIAEILELNESTVRGQLARARRLLKIELEDYNYE